MKNRARDTGIALMLGVLLTGQFGCSKSAGPSEPAVAVTGEWPGVAALPNSVSTSMLLQQVGSDVSGTMSLTGAFRDRPLTGMVSAMTRTFTWTVLSGCEVWSGTLTIAANGREMQGSIGRNGAGCVPQVPNVSGSVTLRR